MSAADDREILAVPGYSGAYRDSETSWEPGTFVDRIRDPQVRETLALHVSTNGFYGLLNRGEHFQEALDCSMALAISNMQLLDKMVELGKVPDKTWPESDWHAALDASLAGERPDYEPGRVRKWLAKTVLRQEIGTRKYVFNLSPWRDRSPTSSSGII